MKIDILAANERGFVDRGWVQSYHSFSFGHYVNRERINFGALRVINDDLIQPLGKFQSHDHANMEIITVVLNGVIEHQDSLGNKAHIHAGEIQVMTAGSGITHSEANPSPKDPLELFQIWIMPRQANLTPSYQQRNFSQAVDELNRWQLLIAPQPQANCLSINQDAYLSLGSFNQTTNYQLKSSKNGVLIMLIDGNATIAGQQLQRRDALMLSETEQAVTIVPTNNCRLIAIEVPMEYTNVD